MANAWRREARHPPPNLTRPFLSRACRKGESESTKSSPFGFPQSFSTHQVLPAPLRSRSPQQHLLPPPLRAQLFPCVFHHHLYRLTGINCSAVTDTTTPKHKTSTPPLYWFALSPLKNHREVTAQRRPQGKVRPPRRCPRQPLPGTSRLGTGRNASPRSHLRLLPKPPPPPPSPGQLTHEVVVPGPLRWDHEEAEEAIREQHLHALVMGWQVALGVVPLVRVLPAPLVAARGQLVGRQRAGARCKTGRKEAKMGQRGETRNEQSLLFCQTFTWRPQRVPERCPHRALGSLPALTCR